MSSVNVYLDIFRKLKKVIPSMVVVIVVVVVWGVDLRVKTGSASTGPTESDVRFILVVLVVVVLVVRAYALGSDRLNEHWTNRIQCSVLFSSSSSSSSEGLCPGSNRLLELWTSRNKRSAQLVVVVVVVLVSTHSSTLDAGTAYSCVPVGTNARLPADRTDLRLCLFFSKLI